MPYPITEGAYRVIFDQAFSLLALGHEVELVTWKNSRKEFEERARLWKEKWPTPQFRYLGPHADARTWRVLSSCWSEEASPENYYYPKSVLKALNQLIEARETSAFRPGFMASAPCDLAIYHYSFAHLWLKAPELLPSEKRRVVHFHNLESELSFLQQQNSRALPRFLQRLIHRKNFEK